MSNRKLARLQQAGEKAYIADTISFEQLAKLVKPYIITNQSPRNNHLVTGIGIGKK
jgi:predicted double-glycine peptidase